MTRSSDALLCGELAPIRPEIEACLPAGHGSGAHAPDLYFVIETSNPMVIDGNGAVRLSAGPAS